MSVWSPQWTAFTREAAIAGQSVSAGLTSLRSANYAATGLYSHGFFSLSIGLERLLKLIFLVDHAVLHDGKYPDETELQTKFGHDLQKLFQYAVTVHERLPNKGDCYELRANGIEHEILSFLSTFAKSTRYYNLDYLVGQQSKATSDPIAEWYVKIGGKILERHYSRRQRTKDIERATLIGAILEEHAMIQHTAEDGSPLNTVQSAAIQSSKNNVIQKYGTVYCARLVRFLYMVLYRLVHNAHSVGLEIPYLYELFFPFMNDDAYLLSRKTFPPRGQGR